MSFFPYLQSPTPHPCFKRYKLPPSQYFSHLFLLSDGSSLDSHSALCSNFTALVRSFLTMLYKIDNPPPYLSIPCPRPAIFLSTEFITNQYIIYFFIYIYVLSFHYVRSLRARTFSVTYLRKWFVFRKYVWNENINICSMFECQWGSPY